MFVEADVFEPVLLELFINIEISVCEYVHFYETLVCFCPIKINQVGYYLILEM